MNAEESAIDEIVRVSYMDERHTAAGIDAHRDSRVWIPTLVSGVRETKPPTPIARTDAMAVRGTKTITFASDRLCKLNAIHIQFSSFLSEVQIPSYQ